DGADGEELLQVGGAAPDAVREILLAEADVPPALLGLGTAHALLLGHRQVEERAGDLVHPPHERLVDAVTDDGEEPDVLARAADLSGHRAPVALAAGQRRHVDHGHARERHTTPEPPSTTSVWPVMNALSSEARNTTVPSTSSATASRLSAREAS